MSVTSRLLTLPTHRRPTKHRTPAKPNARQSRQLHMDPQALEAPPHEHLLSPGDETERITSELHMLALPSKQIQACEESYGNESLAEEC